MQLPQQVNENSADPAKMLPTIQKCTHCGGDTTKGALYCPDCRTVGERKEMCAENKKLMPNYKCKMCQI